MSKPLVTRRGPNAGSAQPVTSDNAARAATRAGKLDALNQALKEAEAHLYDLNIGVEGSVEIDSGTDYAEDTGEPIGAYSSKLTWMRNKSKWGLYVVFSHSEIPDDSVKPVLEATAEERRVSAHALPDLLRILKDNADRELAAFDQATQAARAFAAGAHDDIRAIELPNTDGQ